MTRAGVLCLLSTGHLLRILIPLEEFETPHLTADKILGIAIVSQRLPSLLVKSIAFVLADCPFFIFFNITNSRLQLKIVWLFYVK